MPDPEAKGGYSMQLTHLRSQLEAYGDKYKHIRFRREDGILEMAVHTDGGPLKWGRLPHAELEDAFLHIARDDQNKAVILTGTGDQFSGPRAEVSSNAAAHKMNAEEWAELAWEAKGFTLNFLSIEVPVIAAVNGPALRHPELPALCDIVLASDTASFQDSAHFVGGLVPGDGVHIIFSMIMGLNRARYFLLMGQELNAEEAKNFGLVNEVLPPEKLMSRAWEVARKIRERPDLHRRYARVLITEQLRRQVNDLLPYGLALEGLGMLGKS